ncbi:MAG: hypothetical protein WC889_01070 [Myxococcota bacterium]|jgi:transposase
MSKTTNKFAPEVRERAVRMAATLQPDVRPAKSPELAHLAELMNARNGLVRDRTACRNREKNLTLPLLKRQAKARLEQIERHIKAKYTHLTSIGKPAKVAITAVMRKPIVMANALLKADRLWKEAMA